MNKLLEHLRTLFKKQGLVLVGIDGLGGAGKSMVAKYVKEKVPTAAYMDPAVGQDRATEWDRTSVIWLQNAVDAFNAFKQLSPSGQLVLPDAVGFPDTTYHAQGLSPCAVDTDPLFSGTRAPYSLQLAIGLGDQTATEAIAELRRILEHRPEVWDPLFGFMDSFHSHLADYLNNFPDSHSLVRSPAEGRWVQQQVWPLNKGAALLAQLNFIDNNRVRNTANQHPVISRGISRIFYSGCAPYGSKDWVMPQNCTFKESPCSTALANVIVLEDVALTLAENSCLDIDFSHHHLKVKDGAKVVIKNGGTIR